MRVSAPPSRLATSQPHHPQLSSSLLPSPSSPSSSSFLFPSHMRQTHNEVRHNDEGRFKVGEYVGLESNEGYDKRESRDEGRDK